MLLWVSTFQHDETIRRDEKSIKTCQIAKILLAALRGPKNPARLAVTNSNIVSADDVRATCQNVLTEDHL